MITTCTECQARYQLDDDKIPPRVIKVRCPSCKGVFSLDGTQAMKEAVPAPEQPMDVQEGIEGYTNSPAAEEPVADDPVVEEPVASEPMPAPDPAPSPSASATVEPATEVAVMDRPVTRSSRRRRSKEEMLARALVSDIMVYNRDIYDRAKADGNLLEAMGSEIKKSWELYKEKVTPEVANSTNHFRDALNDILADGEQLF